MVKLLITDIGGTLIDLDNAIISSIERVFTKFKIPFGNRGDLVDFFGLNVYDYIFAYLPDSHKHMIEICYGEFIKYYSDMETDLRKVFDEVDFTLDFIKNRGIKIATLSCLSQSEVNHNLAMLKFQDFDEVFSIEDYKLKKPNPLALEMLMKQFGVTPKETVYVGDTVNDIMAAKNAGCISVAVKTGLQDTSRLQRERPNYLINEFKDLRRLILRL